jgi:C1A family cysteine protease
MTIKIARYGWQPDLPDKRDHLFSAVMAPPIELPPAVSLREKMPPVFNQGELGSCTANASAAAFAFAHGGGPYSRLQIYYGERVIENTIKQDSGAQLRDAVKVLNQSGAAPESDWPYDVSKFARKPTAKVMKDAAKAKITVYNRLITRSDFRACLANSHPFIIGFTVYESFEGPDTAKTGIVTMPKPSEKMIGGHAVCVIGYDTALAKAGGGDYYEVRNSWGDTWGDAGNFWIPAAYLEDNNLADDAWTIRK